MAFELRDEDLRITTSAGSSPGARRGSRIAITIVHLPTGVSVSGEVGPAPGGRTRARSRAARDELTGRLRRELTGKVAARLGIPGR